MSMKPTFNLTLQAEPSGVPAIVRLRRALKVLKRAFGLRCVHIREAKSKEPTHESR